jgi:hypothetical protein
MAHFQSKEFEEFMDSLKHDLATTESPRVIIPVCHIYLEHMLSLIIEKRYSDGKKFLKDPNNGFKKKIDLLKDLTVLSDDEHYDLDLINQIRNNFIHTFKPNLQEIAEKIFKLKFHIYNKNTDPKTVIIYDILQIMIHLEQKLLN